MAKIYNVLRYVDDIKPNRFTDDTKVQWLNEVEGYIQTEVMMLALADVVQYDPEAHMHTDLLVKPPHDKLYALYLCAMIDFANGEYDKYANTMQMYNEFLGEYIGWYTLHFRPADGGCVREGYYLSAYALAVVRGFEGTEDEWLESLQGKPGEDAYDLAVKHGYEGTREEFGRDQAGFAGNAAQVRLDREASERAASGAVSSAAAASSGAATASDAAGEAKTAAGNAAASEASARENAGRAAEYLAEAAAARDTAVGAAGAAGSYASYAESSAAEAVGAKSSAESAASRAEEAAEEAEQAIKDAVKSVNGVLPDENGNVEIELPEGGGTSFEIDSTLTQAGKAADAKAVGDKLGEVSREIDDLGGSGIWYGVTNSGESESPKIVETTSKNFKLVKGSRLGVKFINGNIGANYLNVDGTGVIAMAASNDENGTVSLDTPVTYKPNGQILWFTYDGQYFVVDDTMRATENTVGKVMISDSVSKTSSQTAASSTAVKTAYDKAVEASKAIANLGGGLNATAKSLLITILRNGVYTSDQSANITALETALNESGEDDDTDTGGVTQMGSVLYITGGVTATQSGIALMIA